VRVPLELPRPDPERVALRPLDALGLRSEPAVVVTLDPRALLKERQRAGEGHDRAERDAGHEHEGDGPRRLAPRAATEAEDHDHHHEPGDEVEPGSARIREQHAERQDQERQHLRRAAPRKDARREDLLQEDQSRRHEKRPEDIRIFEEALRPADAREQVVPREQQISASVESSADATAPMYCSALSVGRSSCRSRSRRSTSATQHVDGDAEELGGP
jgi:hypothetical protein